jgi:hypothetical protein
MRSKLDKLKKKQKKPKRRLAQSRKDRRENLYVLVFQPNDLSFFARFAALRETFLALPLFL